MPHAEHCEVTFAKAVATESFEELLKSKYTASKRSAVRTVLFDLSKTQYVDIFQLGMLVVWILDLKRAKKQICVQLPPMSTDAHGFLNQYAFTAFLQGNGVEIKGGRAEAATVSSAGGHVGRGGRQRLTFAAEESMTAHLDALATDPDVADSEVVSGGAFRDVVLKELRDNITKHAKDRHPYVIMTTFRMRGPAQDRAEFLDRLRKRALYGLPWERQFFESLLQLDDPSFVEITIGDGGPGMRKTLGTVPAFARKPESEILRAAFDYDTTSDLETRLKPVKQWLSQSVTDYSSLPPATGLYWFQRAVQKHCGHYTIRSGKTILAFDYLTYPQIGRPGRGLLCNVNLARKKKGTDLRKLRDFPGVQYRILFPLSARKDAASDSSMLTARLDIASRDTSAHVPVLLRGPRHDDASDAAFKYVRDSLGMVADASTRSQVAAPRSVLAVDFADCTYGAVPCGKAFHYLFIDLLRRQAPFLAIVAVGCSRELLNIADHAVSVLQAQTGLVPRVLFCLDRERQRHFLGGTTEDRDLLAKVADAPLVFDSLGASDRARLTANDHLIALHDGRVTLGVSITRGLLAIVRALAAETTEAILDPANRIFNEHVRVDLDRYFAEGFFEVHKILDMPVLKSAVLRWVQYSFMIEKSSVLVCVGPDACALADIIHERPEKA